MADCLRLAAGYAYRAEPWRRDRMGVGLDRPIVMVYSEHRRTPGPLDGSGQPSSGSEVIPVECLRSSTSLEDLGDAFAAAMRPLGIDAYAFGQTPVSGGLGELSLIRWPRWIEYYAINGFAQQDSAIDEMQASCAPFTWAELKVRRPDKGACVFEACGSFGWSDGFIVPVRGRRVAAGFVSLAARSSLRFWDSSQRNRVTALAQAAYAKHLELTAALQAALPHLSAREQEALSLVAHGLSDADIAIVMGIAASTAHAHVERGKTRLGARTRAQAVALAIRAKII